MRKVKCRECKKLNPQDESFLIIHTTKGGNEQKRYYCSEGCYDKEIKEVEMLKQCQYFVDNVFGYVCINNEKNKQIQEIVAAGYTREELYDCMLELQHKIQEGLNYRQDIDKEVNKIKYMFAIIKANIKEITDKKRMDKFQLNQPKEQEIIEYKEQIESKTPTNKRKSLLDRVGG